MNNSPVKLTLDQFIEMWAPRGSGAVTRLRFDHNVTDFTTEAGEYAKQRFESSFSSGRFLGIGSPWPSRESAWGKKFLHDVLRDSMELASSIKGDKKNLNQNYRKQIHRRASSYSIWTTEKSKAVPRKRGQNKNKNNTYAAVHNDPQQIGATVNQNSSRRPTQR